MGDKSIAGNGFLMPVMLRGGELKEETEEGEEESSVTERLRLRTIVVTCSRRIYNDSEVRLLGRDCRTMIEEII